VPAKPKKPIKRDTLLLKSTRDTFFWIILSATAFCNRSLTSAGSPIKNWLFFFLLDKIFGHPLQFLFLNGILGSKLILLWPFWSKSLSDIIQYWVLDFSAPAFESLNYHCPNRTTLKPSSSPSSAQLLLLEHWKSPDNIRAFLWRNRRCEISNLFKIWVAILSSSSQDW